MPRADRCCKGLGSRACLRQVSETNHRLPTSDVTHEVTHLTESGTTIEPPMRELTDAIAAGLRQQPREIAHWYPYDHEYERRDRSSRPARVSLRDQERSL